MKPGLALRQAIDSSQLAYVATVYDAFTAKIAKLAGFDAVMLGSAPVQNAFLGLPDAGFLTLTEMEMIVGRTAAACELPVCVDAENGYGNAVNIIHAVRSIERAGAAAMLIEDQEMPPRGGMSGIPAVLPTAEMVGKIKAAVDARSDESFVVMVRTDIWRHDGLDGVIERGRAYVEAGAEGFFAMAQLSSEEYRKLHAEVPAAFHLNVLGFPPEPLTGQDFQNLGFRMLISGHTPIRASYLTLLERFEDVRQNGTAPIKEIAERISSSSIGQWERLSGFEWLREMEQRYVPSK